MECSITDGMQDETETIKMPDPLDLFNWLPDGLQRDLFAEELYERCSERTPVTWIEILLNPYNDSNVIVTKIKRCIGESKFVQDWFLQNQWVNS